MGLRILHISKSDSGGAGIAAFRLHQAMVNNGIDSKMLCLQTFRQQESSVTKFSDSIFRKILRSTRLPFNKFIKNERILKSRGGKYDSFSFIESDYQVHNHPLVHEADVINLHFINGFVDYSTFFENVKKPIFWTLHDRNPFQGGFHLSYDIKANQENLGDIEEFLSKEKLKIYKKCKNLIIITLNQQMFNLSTKSEHFSGRLNYIIPNTLDTNIFEKSDKNEQRMKFSLPINKKIFLFISYYADNFNKGGDILSEAVEALKDVDMAFYRVGQSDQVNKINTSVINLGSISDETTMANLYSAVDAIIIASREENLPNVMLEALTCGTPVICTPVGGCLDIIENRKNGLITRDFTSESLSEAIVEFGKTLGNFNRDLIRSQALEIFDPRIIVNKYLKAYEKR